MKAQTSTLVSPEVATGAAVTVGLCFAVAVLEGVDIQAMGVAAPKLGAELALAPGALGQALSAANIGLVFGATVGGWLADKFGRKPVLIAAVLAFGAFTLATMFASGYESLFAIRMGAGLGFGGALSNLMAMAAEVGSQSKRSLIGAIMFCGMPVGGGTVALMSWLTPAQNWRMLFLVGGILPLLIAPALALFLRETRKPVKAAAPTAAATSPLYWLGVIPLYAVMYLAASFVVPGSFAVWLAVPPTVVLGYAFLHRHALFGEGRAVASVLIWMIFLPTLLILYLVLNWLPSLVVAKGFPQDASQASVWFNFASVAGGLLFGALVDRFGMRWPVVFSYGGLVATLFLLSGATGLPWILFLSGAVGFFLVGANYALYGAAASYYPGPVRGRGAGAAIAWGRLGSVGGPLVGGYLLAGGASAGSVAFSMVPFAVVAGLAVLLLSFASKPGE